MSIESFFGDIWNIITSSVLCTLLTLGLAILFMLVMVLWKIYKIRSEESWIHQPLGMKKIKRYR